LYCISERLEAYAGENLAIVNTSPVTCSAGCFFEFPLLGTPLWTTTTHIKNNEFLSVA
jgi:hypothetical protein